MIMFPATLAQSQDFAFFSAEKLIPEGSGSSILQIFCFFLQLLLLIVELLPLYCSRAYCVVRLARCSIRTTSDE